MFGIFKRPDPAWRTPPRREKRSIYGLWVSHEATHNITGAELILGHDDADDTLIVGWIAPWQRSIRDYHTPASFAEAHAIYKAMKKWGPPTTPALCRDWQRERLYAWERTAIDAASPKIGPDQMENITRRVSRDFNLAAAPSLAYTKPPKNEGPVSSYYPGRHHIHMGHSELSAVLHELAHTVDDKINGNQWAGHGPSYVRTLLMLAERYQYWLDPVDLERSALAAGLMIAPDTLPCSAKKRRLIPTWFPG